MEKRQHQEIAQGKKEFLKETEMGAGLRNRTGITGNIADATEKVGSIVMPGYDNFADASLTVGTAVTGGTAKQQIEEAKKEAEKRKLKKTLFT